jgi:methanogenic corrinoid protein MtbC1
MISGLVFPPAQQQLVDQADAVSVQLGSFVRALLSPVDEVATHFVEEMLESGVTPQSLYESCFTPAARLLGVMWEQDECSFYDVTVGTGRIQRMVRELSSRFLAGQAFPGSAGKIVFGSAPGEQHSLGISILADFFVRDGWDVHVTSSLGSSDLLDKVRENEYDLLGFSVAVADKAAYLKREIQMVRKVSRKRDIRILIGGQCVSADPTLVKRVGADGFAVDAESAIREARRMISRS